MSAAEEGRDFAAASQVFRREEVKLMFKTISVLSLAGAFFLTLGIGVVEAQPKKKFDREKIQQQLQERAKKAFEEADADKNGKVSRAEYAKYLEKASEKISKRFGEEKTKEFIQKRLEAFDKADTEKTGLNLEQFTQLQRSAFGRTAVAGAQDVVPPPVEGQAGQPHGGQCRGEEARRADVEVHGVPVHEEDRARDLAVVRLVVGAVERSGRRVDADEFGPHAAGCPP